MIAAALSASAPVMRTAAGEPPLGPNGATFRDDQGEMLQNPDERYRATWAKIGALELENGKWLAHPPGFKADGVVWYDSRMDALLDAIDAVVQRTQTFMGNGPGEGTQVSEAYGKAVIRWALSLAPEQDEMVPVTGPSAVDVAEVSAEPDGDDVEGLRRQHQALGAIAAGDAPDAGELAHLIGLKHVAAKGAALKLTKSGQARLAELDGYFDRLMKLSMLPTSLRQLTGMYGLALYRLNERVIAADRAEVAIELETLDLLQQRANGNSSFGVSTTESPAEQLRAQNAAPVGQEPMWRQRGVFRLAIAATPYLVTHDADGCFAVYAEDSSRPFTSATGYHSLANFAEPAFGKTVAEQAAAYIWDHKATSLPQTVYRLPVEGEGWKPVEAGIPASEEIILPANPNKDLGTKTRLQEITDPVVIALLEAHRARTSYPAGHIIQMTNPIVNGVMVTLGTCSCGDSFSYAWGCYELMDAAIEAHRQKFDHLPDRTDGRGHPIGEPAPAAKPKKPRKTAAKSSDGRADEAREPAAIVEDQVGVDRTTEAAKQAGMGSERPSPSETDVGEPPAPTPQIHEADFEDGARSNGGSPASVTLGNNVEHAPIGAGSDDDDDLTIDWPNYDQFLEDKIVTAPMRGIEVARDDLHPWLKPHCKDLTVWALRLGCAAIFASFGLHKTAMQLEWCRQLVRHTGRPSLCVVPLGVRHGFIKEALQLGMDVRFIRTTEELDDLYVEGIRHFLTNYESIREGKLDPNAFGACSLDEASVLRSYGSKTFQEFLPLFAKVPFKLVATATPSPNRYKELIHYSGFLGVMDTGLALTRFFQRNSEKAGDLTLYPHKEQEFWMWMHSWAAFLQRPSDLGYSDDGYEMPPADVRFHELPADHSQAEPERDGQTVLFRKGAASLQESAKARRDSLPARIARMLEIIQASPDDTFLIWHDLEAEREAIEAALPGVVAITGSGMTIDEREVLLHKFEEGEIKYFATKPILSGSGSNFQYHCHRAVYVGMPGDGFKFNDFIQSLYRLQRFGQQHPVEIDIIYSEDMRAGRGALETKWALDTEMRLRMSEIIKAHGLDTLPMREAMLRTLGVKRVEVKGDRFIAINNDAVAECRTWPENSVDLMVSSIPFATQYEYSPRYEDFGHADDNGHFWSQMDFLSTELLRMLKPGRLACIHVKDRILFGAVTGQGVPTVEPFHAEAIMHYRAHGFQYIGMITVVTDVVRENNQTYRLGWSENAKDGTKMGCGMPEYILLLRKPQSDRSRSYADFPVTKSKEDYTRARWQIDAHALWRSSGNRHLTPEEFASFSSADLARLFAKTSAERIYDYEAHVSIGEAVDRTGTLPATFMAIAPGSKHPDVWSDINRMRTLNMLQQRKGAEMHLCPLQFDIVDRLIERYSNPDDLVFDPFGGLMTVPYRALLKGRRGAATELSASYFLDGVHYLHMAEEKLVTPQLFDVAAFDAVNDPPPSGHDGD